jgi:hypothetical protein
MISYKVSAIIMLDTAIDSSINYLIPDEFQYYSPSKKRELTKLDIENLPFKDKLKEVFHFLFKIDITKEYTQLYNSIIVNHKFRKHFIHLSNMKNRQKVEIFYEELGKSINIELEETISQTIELLNKVKPNTFITKPFFNHLINVYKDKQLQTICHPVVNLITIPTAVTDILIE